MPIEQRRTKNLHSTQDETGLRRPGSPAARVEYDRLMVEAKQAFDRIITQGATARLARTTRRGIPKTT